MKRVLIITYYWPPAGGSGVQRWLKFAKYLPQYGWQPVIYTPLNPEVNAEDATLAKDIAPDLEVIKRKILEPYAIYKILSGKKKNEKIEANAVAQKSSGGISVFIRGNFFIPDPRVWWVRPSVNFLKKYLKEHPVDAIVSTGPPQSMHLIAKRLHASLGIPWIADFRDPWTKIFYFKHLNLTKCSRRKHEKLEQGVIDEADKIVVVSPQMKEDFSSMTKTPISIITNGFDPDDFTDGNSDKMGKEVALKIETLTKNKFTIVQTGLLTDAANPDLLWRELGAKAEAEADFRKDFLFVTMGQMDSSVTQEIEEAHLGQNIKNLGYAPHSEAVAWQKRANLLLLPLRKENEAKAILTGKFFEYLASGSSILAIGPTDSNLGDAMRETECGTICDYGDSKGMRRVVDAAYEEFKKSSSSEVENAMGQQRKNISPAARKYSRPALAQQFAELLNEFKK
ncbi:MAG: glycosyltransferase family 4 protein [Bacteroidales bacterium]|nr:glycosyltransferase family 4 protein [Bacteroidales bacterium]MCI1732869.1 glycosyltransferase family 4 protein [Bacteroidales bacterium]